MLRRLHIENFALVDELDIDFLDGMSVLTGETGAGKSIIVGAIGRLLGEKADKDDIRSGARLAAIEGDFDIKASPEIQDALNNLEIESDGEAMTLRREIITNRPSKSFINGQMVTLARLREISGHLAELFGQHSHQLLLDEKNHQSFLDRFAGISDDVETLREIHAGWQKTKLELAQLESRKEIEKNERELLLFQKEEIEKAKIRVGEEEELIAEKKILDSSQLLGEKSASILQMLDR
ncbi:MAG: AAA family ATPase, partial [Candidatus Zixiibacteriota bacterium]